MSALLERVHEIREALEAGDPVRAAALMEDRRHGKWAGRRTGF